MAKLVGRSFEWLLVVSVTHAAISVRLVSAAILQ
jgi:hypothetical protein